jgi:hypothetical protein
MKNIHLILLTSFISYATLSSAAFAAPVDCTFRAPTDLDAQKTAFVIDRMAERGYIFSANSEQRLELDFVDGQNNRRQSQKIMNAELFNAENVAFQSGFTKSSGVLAFRDLRTWKSVIRATINQFDVCPPNLN